MGGGIQKLQELMPAHALITVEIPTLEKQIKALDPDLPFIGEKAEHEATFFTIIPLPMPIVAGIYLVLFRICFQRGKSVID
jgi:hypothetical protein